MSTQKELLLLLITIMHMSSMTSHPVGLKSCEEKQKDFKKKVGFVLLDLKTAESAYVKHFYVNGSNPLRNQEPLDGITFPVGNTTDPITLNSMCAINDYLKNHLPPILNKLTVDVAVKEEIFGNTKKFPFAFEKMAKLMEECQNKDELIDCPRKLPTFSDYGMMTYALQILHAAVTWTESFTM